MFIYDQSRAPGEPQPLVSLGRIDERDPRLAAAIRLMESHVDAPLTIAAIAKRVRVSQRTLEQEFGRLIGEPPGRYYLNLRLALARKMVSDTSLRDDRDRHPHGLFLRRHLQPCVPRAIRQRAEGAAGRALITTPHPPTPPRPCPARAAW